MEYIRVGFMWGFVFALIHGVWAWLVAQKYGQWLIDFLLQIHFLSNPFVVQSFDIKLAYILVGLSGFLGLLAGVSYTLLRSLFFGNSSKYDRKLND